MPGKAATATEIATRFLAAIERRDLAAMDAVIAQDAKFWTNVAQTDSDRASRLERIALEFRLFKTFAFEDARLGDFGTGFVVRARARGSLSNGQRFEFPICLVGDVANGAIVRLEEYFDPSAVAPILAAMAAAEHK